MMLVVLIIFFYPLLIGAQSVNFQQNNDEFFTNPVWDGADPWMVKEGEYYYYCFLANNAIHVSKSKSIIHRGETKTIWKAPSTGWNSSCVWAPEIHFINERWYVYYAAGESGPPFIQQRTGVLRSKTADAFSDYEDMGMLYTGDEYLGHRYDRFAT